ncbi:MAG: tetratricopeptide repeat protein [Muribaculaceae bacterium]|nr:tetratricopeptide repeat protein [Muribaculaceae bacterium]
MEMPDKTSMTHTSLDPQFLPTTVEGTLLRKLTGKRIPPTAELRHLLMSTPFNNLFDSLRKSALDLSSRNGYDAAITTFETANNLVCNIIAGDDNDRLQDVNTVILHILTALHIQAGNPENARKTAAQALNNLSHNPKRRDEPFLTLLATILFDISGLHADASEFKQAERELEKSLKLFDRLGSANPDRYASAHVIATARATQVYRNRVRQADTLALYQETTQTYLSQVNQGLQSAVDQLADSLFTEGLTLADMGRHREAITYFTKALKYYTRLHPDTDLKQLQMSIELGKSLLNIKATRDKGIHLLNTMLHKATKINATGEHRTIVEILANSKTRQLDILDLWHKIFPR